MVKTITYDSRIGPMEIFLLAAVGRGGLDTMYGLQRTVDLEPGSIRNALARLESDGLLVRAAGGKRGRRTMALTEAGEALLETGWNDIGLDPKREMESIIRSVTVAVLMNDMARAIRFLQHCVEERERPGHSGVSMLREISKKSTPIDLHARMREVHDNRRREMEKNVLMEFGDRLKEVAARHGEHVKTYS